MATKMNLVYFGGRGVIEVARYMLHMGGADWEDTRFPITMENGQYLRPVS
jgi:hypothetical protein